MSEAPVRKAPVTTDPASAPPHPQQRQDERQDLRQDPRQETRQDQRQDQRQDPRQERQEQRQDQQAAQRSAQQPGQTPPQHLAHDSAKDATRESARESTRESTRESAARESAQESSKDVSQRPVGKLEDEWQAVQYEFVDDPKSAVRKADDLVQRAIQDLTSRHRTLSQQWQGEGKQETEDLRLALHRYRELFKSLVAVK